MVNKRQESAIIIQARMSSKRLPRKMMSLLAGVPLIEYIYKRCVLCKIPSVVVATSNNHSDDVLFEYCKSKNIPAIRGPLDNVLKRYIQVAGELNAKYIIRICGDTPFVDISLMDSFLKLLISQSLDYVSADKNTCVAGFDSEAVTFAALKRAFSLTKSKQDFEHVTRFIINNPRLFLAKFIDVGLKPKFMRRTKLTIDYPKDTKLANSILNELPNKFSFTSKDILAVVRRKAL